MVSVSGEARLQGSSRLSEKGPWGRHVMFFLKLMVHLRLRCSSFDQPDKRCGCRDHDPMRKHQCLSVPRRSRTLQLPTSSQADSVTLVAFATEHRAGLQMAVTVVRDFARSDLGPCVLRFLFFAVCWHTRTTESFQVAGSKVQDGGKVNSACWVALCLLCRYG